MLEQAADISHTAASKYWRQFNAEAAASRAGGEVEQPAPMQEAIAQ